MLLLSQPCAAVLMSQYFQMSSTMRPSLMVHGSLLGSRCSSHYKALVIAVTFLRLLIKKVSILAPCKLLQATHVCGFDFTDARDQQFCIV